MKRYRWRTLVAYETDRILTGTPVTFALCGSPNGWFPIINTNTNFDMMLLNGISFDQSVPVPEPLTIVLFGSG